MIRVAALLVWLSAPAIAETARVYSGEHADFTRLVIELPNGGEWTVGKTAIGYAFASRTGEPPIFDLSEVWDRIPRTRLQSVVTDTESGSLQLTLACKCHVFPFEYRPGVIVLDVKPGPAPAQSVFEQPFQSVASTTVAPSRPTAQPAEKYDWMDAARTASTSVSTVTELPLDTGGVSLDPIRAGLLEEISRAAARGVIDMTLPGKPVEIVAADDADLPWTQIRIGPPVDSQPANLAVGEMDLTPSGSFCAPDDQFALSEWGGERLPHEIIVEARSDLFGEFDLLDTDAVVNAVQLHLYLGFGAEAAQYANLLTEEDRPDGFDVLLSMTRLVDGESDPQSPLLGMLACDGAAALWAALAHAHLPLGQELNSEAVVRTFLALPSHLRASLGPGLAEKLLERDEPEAARMIRNAVERTPGIPAEAVDLLDASAELHAGRPETALGHVKSAVDNGGSSVFQLIALVEAHFQKGEPLSSEIATSLQAFQEEVGDPEIRADLLRAQALALVLSGQTDAGFDVAKTHGIGVSDLYQIASQLADDDAFLRHAILPEHAAATGVTSEVAFDLATRLVSLGFADAAIDWISPVGPEDSFDRRRLAAKAELARGDARQVIALLKGLEEPEDQALRAKALVQLGALAEAQSAYLAANMPQEAQRLTTWEGNWQGLVAKDLPLWSAAAAVVAPNLPQDLGPLARGEALLEDAAAARSAVNALLAGLATPVE